MPGSSLKLWLAAGAALGIAMLVSLRWPLPFEPVSPAPVTAPPLAYHQPSRNLTAPQFGLIDPLFAPGNPQPAARPREPLTTEAMFQEIAVSYDLDWRLLAEVAYQESRMNPQALGRDNDMGLMQIIPTTWAVFAPQVGVTDPFDPYSNIVVGAAYLAHVRDYSRAQGRWELQWMIVGYNWGPDNLRLLFESGGDWAQVPEPQRRYTLEILEAYSNRAERWRQRP